MLLLFALAVLLCQVIRGHALRRHTLGSHLNFKNSIISSNCSRSLKALNFYLKLTRRMTTGTSSLTLSNLRWQSRNLSTQGHSSFVNSVGSLYIRSDITASFLGLEEARHTSALASL